MLRGRAISAYRFSAPGQRYICGMLCRVLELMLLKQIESVVLFVQDIDAASLVCRIVSGGAI
jgi:HD-like signal output (HDOD) protein